MPYDTDINILSIDNNHGKFEEKRLLPIASCYGHSKKTVKGMAHVVNSPLCKIWQRHSVSETNNQCYHIKTFTEPIATKIWIPRHSIFPKKLVHLYRFHSKRRRKSRGLFKKIHLFHLSIHFCSLTGFGNSLTVLRN